MKIALLQSTDRMAWNDFVARAPSGHILQSWEWGEIKARSGWRAVRLALQDDDGIRAGAQILIRTLPYGFGRLAYVPKGPVLDYSDPALLRSMLAILRSFADRERVVSLKIEPEVVEPSAVPNLLLGVGLKAALPVQMRSTIWLDLTPGEEDILAGWKQKTRYNTRLAARKGVTVTCGGSDGLDAWYAMFSATARRDGFSIHGLDYYRLVLDELQPRGMATLLLAHHEGDLLAGIVVFRFGATAQYMYGASSNQKRNLMAPYLVQWEGMRWAKENGCTLYDLWGIPDRLEENEDLWGVYRFKQGFGGNLVRYVGAFDLVRSPLQHVALERVARPAFKHVARFGAQRAQLT